MVAGASPALVSSLLIRSDQLRLSMFGFRSARSTLAAQWSILRFVVQLSYRPSSPRCALLRVHHQVSGPGLIPAVLAKKRTRGLGIIFFGAPKSHLATCAFSPFATTISPSACPIHAAADLMAPALSAGMLVGVSTAPARMPKPFIPLTINLYYLIYIILVLRWLPIFYG